MLPAGIPWGTCRNAYFKEVFCLLPLREMCAVKPAHGSAAGEAQCGEPLGQRAPESHLHVFMPWYFR